SPRTTTTKQAHWSSMVTSTDVAAGTLTDAVADDTVTSGASSSNAAQHHPEPSDTATPSGPWVTVASDSTSRRNDAPGASTEPSGDTSRTRGPGSGSTSPVGGTTGSAW